MQTVPLISGLSAIADRYAAIICDVWGVLHNGVVGYPDAGEALRRFRASGKPVVLLTNAPRPAFEIEGMLARFGIAPDTFDTIVSSGDATRTLLKREGAVKVFHLGPARDLRLFEGLKLDLVPDTQAELVVCTGLFDDDTETPEDYRAALKRYADRGLRLICANPDIVVERGDRLVFCAGAIARLYEEIGGTVVMVGKPYKPVYDVAMETVAEIAGRPVRHDEVLAIGDALATDVRGAWGQGMGVLMVTAGIHAADFGPADAPDAAAIAKRLAIEGVAVTAAIPRLVW
jgi:HAD superfamily hydrolase (TIGR01459 family)